jgi:surface polysaccharide O-acyltransferase-like enzyme
MIPAQELQSKVIDFLRFPLIVGVVLIHNQTTTVDILGMQFGSEGNMPIFYICRELFSEVLGRVAVPLFFLVSGFLFFQNIDGLTKQSYLQKLKSRGRTLLIPYLFWNITAFLIHYAVLRIDALGISTHKSLALHFWFIRDLMIMIVLTPIVYFYIKKAKAYGVLLLGVLWFFSWWWVFIGGHGLSITATFFFAAGAWFGINKRNLIDDMSKVKRWSLILYPLLVVADLLTKKYTCNIYVHHTGIIVGIACWINLAAYLLKTGTVKVNCFLASSSFFIFATHNFLVPAIKRVFYVALKPESDLLITALYFTIALIVIFITLGLYYLSKRFMPKFTSLITGGR